MEEVAEELARRGPSSADIADWIRQQIRASRLVPGQRLVEIDIIRHTGGSRFKVREAFQRLSAEGLVEIEEFRGASVRGASREEVSQIYRARAALEGMCAGDFTRKAGADDREKLVALEAQIEDCVENGSPELFGRLNAEWHTLIMQGSDNPVFEGLVRRLNMPVHHLLFETFYRGNRLMQAVADHRLILQAIQANDAPGAEEAMRRHVENGHRFLTGLDSAMHLEAQGPAED